MAKTKKVVKEPQVVVEEPQVVEQPKVEVKSPQAPTWEIKDRMYILKGNKQPLVYKIPSKHSSKNPLLYFDQEKGMQKELRYATNQNSPFVEEQKGSATLGHIVFRNGTLAVPARKVALQKLLSLYHPMNGKVYYEDNKEATAVDQVDSIHLEFQAVKVAMELAIEEAEAIMRVEVGNAVSKMSSSEIKRDVLVMAKKRPAEFLQLAADENVHLRNIGIKAAEANIIRLSGDNRSFSWVSNGRKLFTVPFDEHPYSALASWFKTDEGLEVFAAIEKKLR
tara:strand:+ start:158 stop:994 length:837 start_codon:yes stop_codon:yes gene_type:complete